MSDFVPPVKIGKTYPLSYFEQANPRFKGQPGVFDFLGYKLERISRNQVKVVELPVRSNANNDQRCTQVGQIDPGK